MKKTRRLLSLVLTLVFCVGLFPALTIAASAAPGDNATDLQNAINSAMGPTTITLTADITLSAALTIPAGADITLAGAHSLIGAATLNTIIVMGSLTLDGVTVTHASGVAGRGVFVNGGALTLQSGAISGNTSNATGDGAGVWVNGTFTMTGGSVSDNSATNASGGGIFLFGGTATISGGTISGNTAANSGGGVCVVGGTLTLGAATISGNEVTAGIGGGVFIDQGITASISGSTISGNTASGDGGGIYSSSSITITGATISGNEATSGSGGGVFFDPSVTTATLSGGEISDNTASAQGGGVFFNGGALAVNGAELSGNGAEHGGGLYIGDHSSSAAITDSTVSGNTAGGFGGGVFNNAAQFTATDTAVSGNEANFGGGLWFDSNAADATISGGEISDNTASGDGGGVNLQNGSHLSLDGVTVSRNSSTGGNGGGISAAGPDSKLTIGGGTSVTDNAAASGSGGGIWMETLDNLSVDPDTVLNGNEAQDGSGIGYENSDKTYWVVEFDPNGGVLTGNQSILIEDGASADSYMPTDPTREDYTFSGWNTAGDGSGSEFTSDTVVTESLTVHAIWIEIPGIPDTFTVTFNSNGGSAVPSQDVVSGGQADKPVNPTKAGYIFAGWYTDAALTKQYNFSTPVTADITLYAKWTVIPAATFTVTFNSNGGSAVASQTVTDGDQAIRPADPTKSGYIFAGWYSDAALTAAYHFSTSVTADITLYAKWSETSLGIFVVTFNSNGGSAVPSQDVVSGGQADKPAYPTKAGYTFAGWYTDAALTKQYNFSTPVTADITLYAKWTVIPAATFTVTFNSNGGSAVASQTVTDGGQAVRPADPTKSSYIFAGWYSDAALTAAYHFSTPVTADITLYARWSETSLGIFVVTFNSNGGSAVPSQDVVSGGQADKPATPTKAGYTFAGWYSDAALTRPYDFSTPVTADITLYAKWTEKPVVPPIWTNPFTDVSLDAWYFDDVRFVNGTGLMVGTSADKFSPDMPLSRGMVVTILYRMAGSPPVTGLPHNFTDVAADQYFTDAVAWAAANSIAKGYPDGSFRPNEPVSRQELATFFARYAGAAGLTLPSDSPQVFSDNAKIADFAKVAVNALAAADVLNGRPGNILDPTGLATRAEAAAVLHRFIVATGAAA